MNPSCLFLDHLSTLTFRNHSLQDSDRKSPRDSVTGQSSVSQLPNLFGNKKIRQMKQMSRVESKRSGRSVSNGGKSLTIFVHAHLKTFLESAGLALISVRFVHWTHPSPSLASANVFINKTFVFRICLLMRRNDNVDSQLEKCKKNVC